MIGSTGSRCGTECLPRRTEGGRHARSRHVKRLQHLVLIVLACQTRGRKGPLLEWRVDGRHVLTIRTAVTIEDRSLGNLTIYFGPWHGAIVHRIIPIGLSIGFKPVGELVEVRLSIQAIIRIVVVGKCPAMRGSSSLSCSPSDTFSSK